MAKRSSRRTRTRVTKKTATRSRTATGKRKAPSTSKRKPQKMRGHATARSRSATTRRSASASSRRRSTSKTKTDKARIVSTALGVVATAAAAFSKTQAGQRLKQRAGQKVAELVKKGEGFVDRLSAKARQRMREGAEKNGQTRADSIPRASRRGGAGASRQSRTLGQQSLGGASASTRSFARPSERSVMHEIPDWQNKLKMKSVKGSKPIVNPGSHRGRAADR